jgi:N-acetylneuraminate synthase
VTNRCLVIAEAGVNHNGSIELAHKLIDAAREAGANIVKFQTFRADLIVTRQAKKAAYQEAAIGEAGSQFDMLKKLELPREAFKELSDHCRQTNIGFMSTPFDIESAQYLQSIGMDIIKVASGELTNLPLLRALGELKLPMIVSTGMATIGEIESAVDVLERAGMKLEDITLLHCSTEYPAPVEEVNLRAMLTIGSAFPEAKIGYSDHTEGIEISIAAAALGARVLEKHLTLDRVMEGPDHRASLAPAQMKELVLAVRSVCSALGDGRKRPSPTELANRTAARKSLAAAQNIRQGDTFTPENVTVRRPGNGISAMYWDAAIGSKATRDYEAGDLLSEVIVRSDDR